MAPWLSRFAVCAALMVVVAVDGFATPSSNSLSLPSSSSSTSKTSSIIASFPSTQLLDNKHKKLRIRIRRKWLVAALSNNSNANNSNDDGISSSADGTAPSTTPSVVATSTAAATKENYLLLAKEAYQKYYSKQNGDANNGNGGGNDGTEEASPVLSQEEYLKLAMNAWNGAAAVSTGSAASGSEKKDLLMEDGSADGNAAKSALIGQTDGITPTSSPTKPFFASPLMSGMDESPTSSDAAAISQTEQEQREVNNAATKKEKESPDDATNTKTKPLTDILSKFFGKKNQKQNDFDDEERKRENPIVEQKEEDVSNVPYGLRANVLKSSAAPPPLLSSRPAVDSITYKDTGNDAKKSILKGETALQMNSASPSQLSDKVDQGKKVQSQGNVIIIDDSLKASVSSLKEKGIGNSSKDMKKSNFVLSKDDAGLNKIGVKKGGFMLNKGVGLNKLGKKEGFKGGVGLNKIGQKKDSFLFKKGIGLNKESLNSSYKTAFGFKPSDKQKQLLKVGSGASFGKGADVIKGKEAMMGKSTTLLGGNKPGSTKQSPFSKATVPVTADASSLEKRPVEPVLKRPVEPSLKKQPVQKKPNEPIMKKKSSEPSLPLTEGMTAEEAEQVRNSRLASGEATGASLLSSPVSLEEVVSQVTEGQTAEQAEETRNARLIAAEEAARALRSLKGSVRGEVPATNSPKSPKSPLIASPPKVEGPNKGSFSSFGKVTGPGLGKKGISTSKNLSPVQSLKGISNSEDQQGASNNFPAPSNTPWDSSDNDVIPPSLDTTQPTTTAATAKENYLLLAKEAYQKYYSKLNTNDDGNAVPVLSEEEYLRLAMNTWDNTAVSDEDNDRGPLIAGAYDLYDEKTASTPPQSFVPASSSEPFSAPLPRSTIGGINGSSKSRTQVDNPEGQEEAGEGEGEILAFNEKEKQNDISNANNNPITDILTKLNPMSSFFGNKKEIDGTDVKKQEKIEDEDLSNDIISNGTVLKGSVPLLKDNGSDNSSKLKKDSFMLNKGVTLDMLGKKGGFVSNKGAGINKLGKKKGGFVLKKGGIGLNKANTINNRLSGDKQKQSLEGGSTSFGKGAVIKGKESVIGKSPTISGINKLGIAKQSTFDKAKEDGAVGSSSLEKRPVEPILKRPVEPFSKKGPVETRPVEPVLKKKFGSFDVQKGLKKISPNGVFSGGSDNGVASSTKTFWNKGPVQKQAKSAVSAISNGEKETTKSSDVMGFEKKQLAKETSSLKGVFGASKQTNAQDDNSSRATLAMKNSASSVAPGAVDQEPLLPSKGGAASGNEFMAESSLPLTEGMTAEEAENTRNLRLEAADQAAEALRPSQSTTSSAPTSMYKQPFNVLKGSDGGVAATSIAKPFPTEKLIPPPKSTLVAPKETVGNFPQIVEAQKKGGISSFDNPIGKGSKISLPLPLSSKFGKQKMVAGPGLGKKGMSFLKSQAPGSVKGGGVVFGGTSNVPSIKGMNVSKDSLQGASNTFSTPTLKMPLESSDISKQANTQGGSNGPNSFDSDKKVSKGGIGSAFGFFGGAKKSMSAAPLDAPKTTQAVGLGKSMPFVKKSVTGPSFDKGEGTLGSSKLPESKSKGFFSSSAKTPFTKMGDVSNQIGPGDSNKNSALTKASSFQPLKDSVLPGKSFGGGVPPQSLNKFKTVQQQQQGANVPSMKISPNPLKGSTAKMMKGGVEFNKNGGVDLVDTFKAKTGNGPPTATKTPNQDKWNVGTAEGGAGSSSKTLSLNKGPNKSFGSKGPAQFNQLGLKTPKTPVSPDLKGVEDALKGNKPSVFGAQKSMGMSDDKPSGPTSSVPPTTDLPAGQTAIPTMDFAGRNEPGEGINTQQISMVNNPEEEGIMLLRATDEPWLAILGDMAEPPTLPLLHVGKRIRSSDYGTTHEGFLVLSMEDGSNNIQSYRVRPVIAKRPWSMMELNATVPSKVMAFENQQFNTIEENTNLESWEIDYKAASVRRYYEVEIHIAQKFEEKRLFYQRLRQQKQQDEEQKSGIKEEPDPTVNNVADIAVQKFLRVYPDDGSGGPNDNDAIPEYGQTGLDVWGKTLGVGHEWLVYEGRSDTDITLSNVIEMEGPHIQNGKHHLSGIQRRLNLPETYEFGDVLDSVFRSLLEDLVFLSSCNIVHRDLRPANILCDSKNQRLQLTNFGNAVDLNPPRVGLDNNDSLELEAPGSIANTLAADVFSVALVVCSLLFDISNVGVLNKELKEAGYDLDSWLQKALASEWPVGFSNALEYLKARRGLWALLKGAIRPNPLRKKITADSLRQFNEVLGLKSGAIEWTDERRAKVAREESYLESVINPPSGTAGQPNDATPATNTAEDILVSNGVSYQASSDDEGAFDITRAPYKLQPHKPGPKQSASVLSELSRRAEQSAPRVKSSDGDNIEMSSDTASNEYIDVTRLKFSPTRKSLLTNMMDSYAKKRPSTTKAEQQRELPVGYDITRAAFQRVSPQPPERKMPKPAIQTTSKKASAKALEAVNVIAPAGKLGVVVDTPRNNGGCIVSSISNNSPLLGRILVGDIIAAVDDEDVLQLVADDVSMILLRKSTNALRKITVLRYIDAIDKKQSPPNDAGQIVVDDGGGLAQSDSEEVVAIARKPADEGCFEEVEQWLMSYLPRLQKDDALYYCKCLIDDGFDSLDMLEELVIEDVSLFMKKAHQRVLARRISGSTDKKSLPPAPGEQSFPAKKVYKVDEALGEAARKGIEAKIAEAKQLASKEKKAAAAAKKTEWEINDAKKKLEAEMRAKADEEVRSRLSEAEKNQAEAERKIKEAKELIEHEARAQADEEARLRRFEADQKKLEEQIELEAKAIEMRAGARKAEFKRLADEANREKERYTSRLAEYELLTEEANRLKQTEAWIKEQNELVRMRNAARIAKEERLREEAENDAASQLDLELEAKRLKETEAWIKQQNDLAKKRHRARIEREKNLKEEEERHATRQAVFERLQEEASRLKETKEWITEQNKLVKKRHASRINNEKVPLEEAENNPSSEIDADQDVKGLSSKKTGASRATAKEGLGKSAKVQKLAEHFPVIEGNTAEEAELARQTRLAAADATHDPKPENGTSTKATKSTKDFRVMEGDTAEEAELARKARLSAADEEARKNKGEL